MLMVEARPSTKKFFEYCPHIPSTKQRKFLSLPNKESFYGGAAGGGKSDALLMGALQDVDVPGYSALLLRKTYKDLSLPEALISRSHEWLSNTDAHWNGMDHKWTFPSGATISFGYLDHENAKFNYQSAAFQYIGFDEVTQFTETQYKYLFSRLRRLQGKKLDLRMRCAANPDGIGFEWVKRRFVNPGDPARPFIPSRLEDNPHLDQVAYDASLAELDPITRARYRLGDWDVRPEGKKFRREWFEIVDQAPREWRGIIRFWDMAATEAKEGKDPDWTVGTLALITKDNIVYIVNVQRFRLTPGSSETRVHQAAQLDGKKVSVGMEQEPGASGIIANDHYRKDVLLGWPFHSIPSTGSKEVRANPMASYAEAGNVKLVAGPWIEAWLDELTIFPDGEHDDQIDSASGAFNFLAGPMPSTAELLARARIAGSNPK